MLYQIIVPNKENEGSENDNDNYVIPAADLTAFFLLFQEYQELLHRIKVYIYIYIIVINILRSLTQS